MMKSVLPLLLFFASVVSVHAEDAERYEVPNYKIGKIESFKVTNPSYRNGYDQTENCKRFHMTRTKGQFFIRHAKLISEFATFHDYSFTSCSAKGSVKFVNGDDAVWVINHNGTASLTFKNGIFKDKLINLYCQRCDDMDM